MQKWFKRKLKQTTKKCNYKQKIKKETAWKNIREMATSTMQSAASSAPGSVSANNPQLKRVVYSKYRELLGSYNDKANAIIDTLPAYMVHKDRGFQLPELHPVTNGDAKNCLESS